MNRSVVTVLLAQFLLSGCAQVVADKPGLDYFGFAAIDCAWDDPTDSETKSNYAGEVAGFTNIAQLCVFSPQDVLSERLGVFKQFGVKAMLSIEPILFESRADTDSPSGQRISLFPDAERRWQSVCAAQ